MVDAEARGLEGGAQRRTPGRVARVLLLDVSIVVEGGDHGVLLRPGHHQPEVLAHRQELADDGGVAGHEGAAVAGQVGALRERVHGQEALVRPPRDRGMQHRERRGVPAALDVALVADQEHPPFPAPGDDLAQVVGRQHTAGRVGRRVQPEQARSLGSEGRQRVGREAAGPGQARTHLVGRVGQRGVDHQVAGTEAEVDGQGGDELLRADHRQDPVEAETAHAVVAREPVDACLASLGQPDGDGIAVGVRCVTQRPLDHGGSRVHRRADGKVDDAVRVGAGALGVLRQLVPGEIREPGRHVRGGHSWFCGGRASMKG